MNLKRSTALSAAIGAGVLFAACGSAPEPEAPTPVVINPAPPVSPPGPPPPPPPPPTPVPTPSSDKFPERLVLCPLMGVQNKPAGISGLEITSYTPFALIDNQVILARAPVENSCFSSGYGMRTRSDGSERLHKGIDLHNSQSVNILAAGDGTVRQIISDAGYGQFIIIDHGSGVFTRYAHLASYTGGLSEGSSVQAGDVIGRMGTTPSVAIHLHYEVLLGDWIGGPSASYVLDAIDIMAQPAAN